MLHFNLILVQNIVVNKRGFAFIDLPDQVALDKAIEKLSGLKINGKEISVEHSGTFLGPGLGNLSSKNRLADRIFFMSSKSKV